jgi:hypothetical protein
MGVSHPRVLLVASDEELNLGALEASLQHRGVAYARINPVYDAGHHVSLRLGAKFEARLHDVVGNAFALEAVRTVWTRGASSIGSRRPELNTAANRSLAEVSHVWAYAWDLLRDRRWVNPIRSLTEVNRLSQFSVAARHGFCIAESLVTTRGGEVQAFVDECGPCIVKPISQGGRLESGPTQVMTSLVGTRALPATFAVPALVQRRVESQTELRAIVVGDRCFVAAIDAPPAAEAVDSRSWGRHARSYYASRLGRDEEDALMSVASELDYLYAAFDLIRSPDGSLTFLEANPAGQWSFVEHQTGLPVTEALVDLLTEC